MQNIQDAQDDLEQYTRRDCLEIHGIPEITGENTDDIVKNVASIIGVELEESDISVSHRLGTSYQNQPKSIIVKFTRREKRDKMYLAKNKLKDLGTKDLGYTRFNNSNIFMVESLTSKRRNLFKDSLQVKKSEGYRYLWTRQGKIFMRTDNDSPAAIHITSKMQLERLIINK